MLIAGLRRHIGSWYLWLLAPWMFLALTGGGFHNHPDHVTGVFVHQTDMVPPVAPGAVPPPSGGEFTRGTDGNNRPHLCPACLWQLTAFSLIPEGMPDLCLLAPSSLTLASCPEPDFFSTPAYGARSPPLT